MSQHRRSWLLLGVALSLSACASVPDIPVPDSDAVTSTAVVPSVWSERLRRQYDDLQSTPSASLWAGFDDSELTDLVSLALANNPDMRAAQARILEAEAALRLTGAAARPSLATTASAARERTSLNGPGPQRFIPNIDLEENAFSLGGRASWEPDIWGRNSLETEAAAQRIEALSADADAIALSLQNQTARLYIQLRDAQAQKQVLENNIALVEETVRLTELLFSQSLAPEFNVISARTRAATLRVRLEDVNSRAVNLAYAIATITGQEPAKADDLLVTMRQVPQYEAGIPYALPSDLLSRRPDILSARAQLLAARNEDDATQLNRLPQFSLTGEGGLLSTTLEDLISTDARRGVISAALNWPIFAGGRLEAERDISAAQVSQAEAAYDKVVLQSLNDVETAFETYVSASRRLRQLKALDVDLNRLTTLADLRYVNDLDSQFQVLDAKANLLNNQSSIATAQADIALALVKINAALGGFWLAQ